MIVSSRPLLLVATACTLASGPALAAGPAQPQPDLPDPGRPPATEPPAQEERPESPSPYAAVPNPPDETDVIGEALAPREGGLTAQAVADRAVAASPAIAAKEAELQIAAAQVDQAMASFAPVLNVSASYTRLSDVNVTFGSGALVGALNPGPLSSGACPDGSAGCVVDAGGTPVVATAFQIPQVLDNFSLAASLSVPISDYVFRGVHGLAAAHASERAAEIAQVAETRRARADAQVAYYNWVRAVAQIAVAEDALGTAQARVKDAEVGFRVGVTMKADLLRVQALVANAEQAVVSAKNFERVARRSLAVMMDEPVGAYAVGEDVLLLPVDPVDADLDTLVATAEQSRPELAVVEKNMVALRKGIKLEKAGYYPRLDAFGDVLYANPNPRYFPPTDEFEETWQVGVRLSYSVTGAIQTRQRIKELNARQRALDAQLEALRRGIELEVSQAWAERRNAMAAIELARVAREASEAGYKAAVAQFKAGTATATDLITAQGEQVSAQLQYVNAHIDVRVAETKLRYATGLEQVVPQRALPSPG